MYGRKSANHKWHRIVAVEYPCADEDAAFITTILTEYSWCNIKGFNEWAANVPAKEKCMRCKHYEDHGLQLDITK